MNKQTKAEKREFIRRNNSKMIVTNRNIFLIQQIKAAKVEKEDKK